MLKVNQRIMDISYSSDIEQSCLAVVSNMPFIVSQAASLLSGGFIKHFCYGACDQHDVYSSIILPMCKQNKSGHGVTCILLQIIQMSSLPSSDF